MVELRYSRLVLLAFLFTLFLPLASAQTVFLIDLTILPDDTVTVEEIDITEGTVSAPQPGAYNVSLETEDGESVYRTSFRMSYPFGENDMRYNTTTLRLPYKKSATSLLIEHERDAISSISLTERLCTSDGFCRTYCTGKNADTDCSTSADDTDAQPGEQGPDSPFLRIIAGLVIVIAGAVFFLRMRSD